MKKNADRRTFSVACRLDSGLAFRPVVPYHQGYYDVKSRGKAIDWAGKADQLASLSDAFIDHPGNVIQWVASNLELSVSAVHRTLHRRASTDHGVQQFRHQYYYLMGLRRARRYPDSPPG